MELTKFDLQYAALRRAIIEREFARMNEGQRAAVFHTEGPLLVLAGAGSGKTTVLINRISNLLRFGGGSSAQCAPAGATAEDLLFLAQYLDHPAEENRDKAERLCAVNPPRPWEVIAITFTNKAAAELRARLTVAVGEADASEVWAYTFHTACLRILRRYIERLGYEAAFTIYDEDDKKRVIKDILRRLNLDEKVFDPRAVISAISRAKDSLIGPAAYAAAASGDFYKGKVAEVYSLYEKSMRNANALDFDDIIVKTVQLLQEDTEVREKYQRQFRYVLVDEYQDTNHAQYVLTGLLAGGYHNICVVGDDDQSIYKFRGATISNILEFEEQYADAVTIRLEQNYRSTGNILAAANGLIRNNIQRKGKELWTAADGGDKLHVHRAETQDMEASFIAKTILENVAKGKKWSDHAILYRNNVLSNNIESAFRKNSIPYRIYKGRDFFSRAEIRDMFAYLWVIENPSDELRLTRIINVPARKIGDTSVEHAAQEAAREGKSLYDVVLHADEYPTLSRAATAMTSFGRMMENLREQREFLSLTELYDEMLSKTGYTAMLIEKNDMESRSRYENILELKSNMAEYEAHTENPSLAGFLEEMALYTDMDHDEEEDDTVLLMTMHSAKGLEFPVVFLCGMEEGLFPGFRAAESEEDTEEERRLCYVAVTRAREELYITCADRRMLYGRTQYAKPSRFVQELPPELLDAEIPEPAPVPKPAVSAEWQKRRTEVASARRVTLATNSPTAGALPDFGTGDRVRHRVFGEGLVVSVKAMGGDLLLEIAFDEKGTKRLMAKSAAPFMQKI